MNHNDNRKDVNLLIIITIIFDVNNHNNNNGVLESQCLAFGWEAFLGLLGFQGLRFKGRYMNLKKSNRAPFRVPFTRVYT